MNTSYDTNTVTLENFGFSNFEGESWKTIDGYDGIYLVSDFGRVFLTGRHVRLNNAYLKPRFLTFQENRKGYLTVNLTDSNGKRTRAGVHRFVASAFKPNPENKPQVNHLDGDKKNNHASNLEWVNCMENVKHSWDSGLAKPLKGEKHGNSKLTDLQAYEIKNSSLSIKSSFLSKIYGIDVKTVQKIRRGKTWKHIG